MPAAQGLPNTPGGVSELATFQAGAVSPAQPPVYGYPMPVWDGTTPTEVGSPQAQQVLAAGGMAEAHLLQVDLGDGVA